MPTEALRLRPGEPRSPAVKQRPDLFTRASPALLKSFTPGAPTQRQGEANTDVVPISSPNTMNKLLVLLATLWMALIVGAGGNQLLPNHKPSNSNSVMGVYSLMHAKPL